jgi:CheY-like chemotaxis protein
MEHSPPQPKPADGTSRRAGAEGPQAGGRGNRDAPGGRARVLVADDSEINRHLARRILERLGCAVVTASDGAEAVEAVRREPFDLVLMDLHMPGMDGFAATATIRALDDAERRSVPIIALTADAMAEDRGRCLSTGMTDHIAKPFTLRSIEDAVERNVRR